MLFLLPVVAAQARDPNEPRNKQIENAALESVWLTTAWDDDTSLKVTMMVFLVRSLLVSFLFALPQPSCCFTVPWLFANLMASASASSRSLEGSNNDGPMDQGNAESALSARARTSSSGNTAASSNQGQKKKFIYGIRHGKSESNEDMELQGNHWGDITFRDDMRWRDSPLSERGKLEASQLAERLVDVNLSPWLRDVDLVVLSPLTRCLMTYDLGVKPAMAAAGKTKDEVPVVVLPLITERVYTAADWGQTIAGLRREWGDEFDWEVALASYGADEPWWYEGSGESGDKPGAMEEEEWRPHGDGQYYAVPGEPEASFERRMVEADEWISMRREKNILVVAHWGVLRHWTGEEVTNGGICRVEWKPGTAAEDKYS